MTNKSTERKPRFKRTDIRPFQLQDRDIEIIKGVYKHRFLTSQHLAILLEGSKQVLLRRLQLLYHAGYLDRPREQIKPYKAGSSAMAYGIGNKGADYLNKTLGIPRSKVDWTTKNREVKTVFLEHTLSISNFMVCIETACRARADVQFIDPRRFVKEYPITWKLTKAIDGKKHTFNIYPDNLFALYYPKDKSTAYFFLEVDRSTMPIVATNFFRSSFYKKLLLYWLSWKDGLFANYLGFENVRILTLAKSKDRIKNMIEAGKEIDDRKKGSRMFMFALDKEFNPEDPGHALDKIWQNGKDGDVLSLLD